MPTKNEEIKNLCPQRDALLEFNSPLFRRLAISKVSPASCPRVRCGTRAGLGLQHDLPLPCAWESRAILEQHDWGPFDLVLSDTVRHLRSDSLSARRHRFPGNRFLPNYTIGLPRITGVQLDLPDYEVSSPEYFPRHIYTQTDYVGHRANPQDHHHG